MNITDVRVRKVAKEGKMKAVVSITIDDEFVVHDIKVIEGEKVPPNGEISYPSFVNSGKNFFNKISSCIVRDKMIGGLTI